MMKPVVWGVLSVSDHYTNRVHGAVSKSPLIDVRAIASRSRPRSEQAASALGIPRAYGSYEALLDDGDIEAVYLPLPNHLHAEWVKKAADAGKQVLCEKPFATDAPQAKDAIDHAHGKGVRVMEAFMYRFHPLWRRAREAVEKGEIGEAHAIHMMFAYSLTDPQNIRNRREAGGGALFDLGCYATSMARYLLGREPGRVLSLVRRDAALRTDTLSSAILDFESARALFTVATQSLSQQRVEVYGSRGSISIPIPITAPPDEPAQLLLASASGPQAISFPPADQYALMFEAFSRAVRQEAPVPTDPCDALNNTKVLDALFRSEESHAWEEVVT
jgi:predicted dehydrogenase